MLRVQVFESALREFFAEQCVGGTADPEGMPGTEEVVHESRLGQLRGLDGTAELVFRLEHTDAPAAACEQSRSRE